MQKDGKQGSEREEACGGRHGGRKPEQFRR